MVERNIRKKKNKGFTLVELVIVMAILAILVGLLAPQYTKYVEKSRKAADASNMDELVKAIQVYATDKAITPTAGSTEKKITIKLTASKVDCSDKDALAAFEEYVPNYKNIKCKSKQWGGEPTVEVTIDTEGGVKVSVPDIPAKFKEYYGAGSTGDAAKDKDNG